MTDYTNSQEFADQVTDNTLKTLRDQEDDKQEQSLTGVYTVNPQIFDPLDKSIDLAQRIQQQYYLNQHLSDANLAKRNLVVGPIKFESKFQGPPVATFGQAPQQGLETQTPLVANKYTPFLVSPYIHSWVWNNGEVDGFYLGLYALTSPIPGIYTHIITWHCVGKASRYHEQDTEESWDMGYDQNDAGFLEEVDDYSGEPAIEGPEDVLE